MVESFKYIHGYEYKDGWDQFALRYAKLMQPDTVYMLTKRLMHETVDRYFKPVNNNVHVLDVNCGTGNDFDFFLNKGWSVIGTDGSAGMLNLAAEKYTHALERGNLKLYKGMLEKWEVRDFGTQRFDLIYSVTGGFSYIDDNEVKRINSVLLQLLEPGGKLIVANLNTFCLFESLFFALKGRFPEMFRRKRGSIKVKVGGIEMKMFLRDKEDLNRLYSETFHVEAQKPLMAFTPPYQTGYRSSRTLLKLHKQLERLSNHFPLANWFSDQVITICSAEQT